MKNISVSSLFLFILFVGMTIIAYTLWQDKRTLAGDNERLRNDRSEATNTIIEKYVDRVDTFEHTVFQDRIITRDQLKKGQVPIDKDLLDSMVLGLKTADGDRKKFNNRISELTRIKANLEGRIKGIEGDKADGVLYSFPSKYLNAHVDTSLNLNYKYNAEIRVAAIEEPTGFLGLGKSRHYVDISSPDTNFTINSIDRFRVETPIRPKKWGVGFVGGWVVNREENGELSLRPAIGIGVSFNVIRF